MPCRRSHFLDLGPAHVNAFPCRRQHREKPVTGIVARKIHHVEITQTRNSLDHIVRVGHSKFAPDLVYDNAVDAPVEPVLRRRFAYHHNRLERINRRALQRKPIVHGIHLIDHDTRKRIRQIDPISPRNIDVQKIARRIRPLDSHATTIQKATGTRMRNHEHPLGVRILRKRHVKRRIPGLVCRHHGVIHKTQIIPATRLVVLGGLFALHLLGTVIVDHRLVELVSFSLFREHSRLDDQFATAYGLVIGVRKIQVLFPVRNFSTSARRIQVISRRIGIEQPRPCRKRIIRRFFLELHAQHENIKRIHGMRQREHAQKQCKKPSI